MVEKANKRELILAAAREIFGEKGYHSTTSEEIAKKAGVRTTIAHARSAGVDPGLKGMMTRFLRRDLYKKCDYRFWWHG